MILYIHSIHEDAGETMKKDSSPRNTPLFVLTSIEVLLRVVFQSLF